MDLPCTIVQKNKTSMTIEYPEVDVSSNVDIVLKFRNGKMTYKLIQYLTDNNIDKKKLEIPNKNIEQKYTSILNHAKYNTELPLDKVLDNTRNILKTITNIKDCNEHKYILSKYRIAFFRFLQSYEDDKHLGYDEHAPMPLIKYICTYRDIITYILELVGIDSRENCMSPHEHLRENCGFIHHAFYNKGYKHQYNLNYIRYIIANHKFIFADKQKGSTALSSATQDLTALGVAKKNPTAFGFSSQDFLDHMQILNNKLINEIQTTQTHINYIENDTRYLCLNLGVCNYKKNNNCYYIHDINDEKNLLIYIHDIANLLRSYPFFKFEHNMCNVCETKEYNAICVNKHVTKRVYYNCISQNKNLSAKNLNELFKQMSV